MKKSGNTSVVNKSIRVEGPYEIDRWRITVTGDDETKFIVNLWTYDAEDAQSKTPAKLNFDGNLLQPAKTR